MTGDEASGVERLPDDNPFADVARELREDGKDWGEIIDLLYEASDPVDELACEEDLTEVPIFEAEVVVPDHKSTSGERYETRKVEEALDRDEAERQLADDPEVRRVESLEQVNTMGVYL